MKIPLVLLPGLLSDKRVWMHQIQHLKDVADVQIISLSQDTPEKMIHSLLEEAPPKFALAGHSMGGVAVFGGYEGCTGTGNTTLFNQYNVTHGYGRKKRETLSHDRKSRRGLFSGNC